MIEKRGDRYVVTQTKNLLSDLLPPITAELLSCDGRDVENILYEDILKYRFRTKYLNAQKVRNARYIFIHSGFGVENEFSSCVFSVDGETRNYDLDWSKEWAYHIYKKVARAEPKSYYDMEMLIDKTLWVTLRSFWPASGSSDEVKLRKLIEELELISITAKQIVVDVRGNGGGNSEWGDLIFEAIYGQSTYIEPDTERNLEENNAYWRVSKQNLTYLRSLIPELRKTFSDSSNIYIEFASTADRMEGALKRKIDLIPQNLKSKNKLETQKNQVVPESEINATKRNSDTPIFLLTDSACGSACLDFADIMLSQSNVVHIGEETSADTVYMDVRFVELPSGLGTYALPMKVYRGRMRGHNESYKPAIVFDGNMSDTNALRTWFFTRVMSVQRQTAR